MILMNKEEYGEWTLGELEENGIPLTWEKYVEECDAVKEGYCVKCLTDDGELVELEYKTEHFQTLPPETTIRCPKCGMEY